MENPELEEQGTKVPVEMENAGSQGVVEFDSDEAIPFGGEESAEADESTETEESAGDVEAAEETAPRYFCEMNSYVKAGDYCVMVYVSATADEEAALPTDDQLREYTEGAIGSITIGK